LHQKNITEGGLPARLFRNGISPPKSEEAGKDLSACAAQADACTTFSSLVMFCRTWWFIPLSYPDTSGAL